MHLSTTILFPLTLLLITSTAAPTKPHLQRRGLPGAVYICTDSNFRGNCAWQGPSDSCRIVGTGAMAPESVGPDPGGFCQLFSNSGCRENPVRTLRFPGAAGGLPRFQSIKCFKDGGFRYRPAGRVSTNPDSDEDENVRPKAGQPKLKGEVVEDSDIEDAGFDISEGVIGLKKQGTVENPEDSVPVGSQRSKKPSLKGTVVDPVDLAGGVGSTERKEVEEQLREMEKDGFSQGFIGQKKELYY